MALLISADPRVEAYARLLVERCLDVQPGMQVLIRTTPFARPAILALQREIARRDAYPILRVGWSMWPANPVWAAEAPEELLGELPEIDRFAVDRMDARITMDAPENSRDAPTSRRSGSSSRRRPSTTSSAARWRARSRG